MQNKISHIFTTTLVSLAALALLAPSLQAGQPLTCFPFQIGNARSLPWDSVEDQRNWNAPKSGYDTRRLADDTVTLLDDDTPVIVRMETIRRAAIYGLKDAAAAEDLFARIKTRALNGKTGRGIAVHLFDYGYLVETYKQAFHEGDKKGLRSAYAENGYARILEALALRGNDAEMEFAAAIITNRPRQERHPEHFKRAVIGAASDPLLAGNLISHFSDRGNSLAELRASAAAFPGKY